MPSYSSIYKSTYPRRGIINSGILQLTLLIEIDDVSVIIIKPPPFKFTLIHSDITKLSLPTIIISSN